MATGSCGVSDDANAGGEGLLMEGTAGILACSLVPRLSVKREMSDPSHSGGFGFPPYFPVLDFIIIIIFV